MFFFAATQKRLEQELKQREKKITELQIGTKTKDETKKCEESISDCSDLYNLGIRKSGAFLIKPQGAASYFLQCDMSDHAWTVILNRVDGSQDFNLDWIAYREGFGNIEGEHWLGNEKLHQITSKKNCSMKMEVAYCDTEEKGYALYETFMVGAENSNYMMFVNGYSRTTGQIVTTTETWIDPVLRCTKVATGIRIVSLYILLASTI